MIVTYAPDIESSLARSLASSQLVESAADTAKRLQLEGSRTHDFHLLLAMTVLVAIGVIMEGPEIFHEARNAWAQCRRRRARHRSVAPWITLIGALGWLFIVVGVAGEGIWEGKVSDDDAAITTFDETKLAIAERDAGNARDSANAANRALAEAQGKLNAVSTKADQITQQLATTEQGVVAMTPRSQLLQEKRTVFIESVEQFKGQKYSIVHCGPWPPVGPVEQQNLEGILRIALDDAGWVEGDPLYSESEGCSNPWGTYVAFSAATDSAVNGGDAVVEAFTKVGIQSIPIAIAPTSLASLANLDLPFKPPESGLAKDPSLVVFVVGQNPMMGIDDKQKKRVKELIERNKRRR